MKIRLMTYNILAGRDFDAIQKGMSFDAPEVVKIELAAEVIKNMKADIVCMNEVHGPGGIFGEQAKQAAELAGYEYYYFAPAIVAGGSPYGNAVLSKYPIVSAEKIMIPDSSETAEMGESRVVACVTVDVEGKYITVLATHFGLLEAERDEAVKLLGELVDKAEDKCVLMGDFNCSPSSKHICELNKLLQDTIPEAEKQKRTFIGMEEPSYKIDYIFVDKSIKVYGADIVHETASDHYPVIADIEI